MQWAKLANVEPARQAWDSGLCLLPFAFCFFFIFS